MKEGTQFEIVTQTPWGMSDYGFYYEEPSLSGIKWINTPGHGGFRLTPEAWKRMPAALRMGGEGFAGHMWYEEDCEYAFVLLAFPELMEGCARQAERARKSLRDWHPFEYEQFTGEKIARGESVTRDRTLFWEDNKGKWVVISARSHPEKEGIVIATAVCSNGTELDYGDNTGHKTFHVASEDYDQRGRFGYVIGEKDGEKTASVAA